MTTETNTASAEQPTEPEIPFTPAAHQGKLINCLICGGGAEPITEKSPFLTTPRDPAFRCRINPHHLADKAGNFFLL